MKSRITPDEAFPEKLERLRDEEVEVLNSKVHREIDHEYATDGQVDAETASRKDELADELDERDAGPRLSLVPAQEDEADDEASAPSSASAPVSASAVAAMSVAVAGSCSDDESSSGHTGSAHGRSWSDTERR